jgi:nascent polypeptide-associated complex subunit alpha
MMPGIGRGISPHRMKRLMKQFGISVEELKDVEEIIIRTSSSEYVFNDATVTIMDAKGQKTYQIIGVPRIIAREVEEKGEVEVEEKEKEEEAEGVLEIPEEDVELVAEQANVSLEEARKALEECNGNPAEAILKLIGET